MTQLLEQKMLVLEPKMLGLAEGVNEKDFFNIAKNLPALNERDFSHVSYKLLREYGYLKDGELDHPLFIKLLNKARKIVVNSRKHLGSVEPYLFDEIDVTEGKKRIILVCQNVDGKTSISHPTELPKQAQALGDDFKF